MSDSPSPSETPSLRDDWGSVLETFKQRRFGRALKWTFGISPRLTRRRLERLWTAKDAKGLTALLENRSADRIKALRTLASLNQEQAAAALRMTAIVNVSIPVIFVTVATQISDGAFWGNLLNIYADIPNGIDILVLGLFLTLAVLCVLLGMGASRLGEARDIRHIIDLHAAERGIYFGLEDADDMQSPPA